MTGVSVVARMRAAPGGMARVSVMPRVRILGRDRTMSCVVSVRGMVAMRGMIRMLRLRVVSGVGVVRRVCGVICCVCVGGHFPGPSQPFSIFRTDQS